MDNWKSGSLQHRTEGRCPSEQENVETEAWGPVGADGATWIFHGLLPPRAITWEITHIFLKEQHSWGKELRNVKNTPWTVLSGTPLLLAMSGSPNPGSEFCPSTFPPPTNTWPGKYSFPLLTISIPEIGEVPTCTQWIFLDFPALSFSLH